MNDYVTADDLRAMRDACVARRKQLGLTQVQLAKRMGIQQNTVSKFEKGDNPRLTTVQRYAKAMHATVEVEVTFTAQT